MDSDPDKDSRGPFDCENNPFLKNLRKLASAGGERHTVNMWTYVFNKKCFPEDNYLVTQEIPPEFFNDQTKMDICVQEFLQMAKAVHNSVSPDYTLSITIIGEAKQGRAGLRDIKTVEEQAFEKSERYLSSVGVDSVWVATFNGPGYRFWAADVAHPYLIPFYPNIEIRGERDAYIDLKGSESQFLRVIKYIKENNRPNVEIFDTVIRDLGIDVHGHPATQ